MPPARQDLSREAVARYPAAHCGGMTMAKLSDITPTGDLMPVGLFVWLCDHGLIHDRRGFGLPVTDREVDTGAVVLPSARDRLPPTITHVLWFDESVPMAGC
jgi:hypothetical protein